MSALLGGRARLWRVRAGKTRLLAGPPAAPPPAEPLKAGLSGNSWFAPLPGVAGTWLELEGDPARVALGGPAVAASVNAVLLSSLETARVTEELAGRYEEIDLLYAISEILGQTVRLEEAAETIVREVSAVVGARRASIMVYDEPSHELRIVAARGIDPAELRPVEAGDECSVAAQVFRERRPIAAIDGRPFEQSSDDPKQYRGRAYLSVPICYASSGGGSRCVGVINLTDRVVRDEFSPGDIKLVSAVANQIGVAIENARLVVRDLAQQRIRRELELAHDLQLKLLPSPTVLQGDAHVAARCIPADSVGGDFYTFSRLGRGRVGVMLGDVSSHGFSAALVMALVLSAAGIHSGASMTPDETLEELRLSLAEELARTEMYFTVFYGVLDPNNGQLSYASAGHPYAFRVPRFGPPERLEATAPPLGLAGALIRRALVPWSVQSDLLCLCTDGLVDARNAEGQPFGEQRLLDAISSRRNESPDAIVEAVLAEVDAFSPAPADDRTLLVLHM